MSIRRGIIEAQDGFIPPEYVKCDYLQTIGHNAKIDSGVKGDDTSLRIEFDWMVSKGTASSWGSYYGMLGQLSVSGKQRWVIMRNTSSSDQNCTYWLTYAGTGVNSTIHPFGSGVTCADKKMHFDIRYGTITINEESGSSSSTNPMNDENVYFGTTSPTSAGVANHIGKFWYIKMWSNNVLIRNYVPCYRRSDNKAGFYDTVNHTFNPSIGSADFEAGYDS